LENGTGALGLYSLGAARPPRTYI